MRRHARRLEAFTLALALAGCASTPPHYPSETAQSYIGKTLFNLEMRWSTPFRISTAHGAQRATWEFSQYNFDGCSVTVRTDADGIIRAVSWQRGCGPKGTGSPR